MELVDFADQDVKYVTSTLHETGDREQPEAQKLECKRAIFGESRYL